MTKANKDLLYIAGGIGLLWWLSKKNKPLVAIPVVPTARVATGVLVSDRPRGGVLVSDRGVGGVLVSDRFLKRAGVLVSD